MASLLLAGAASSQVVHGAGASWPGRGARLLCCAAVLPACVGERPARRLPGPAWPSALAWPPAMPAVVRDLPDLQRVSLLFAQHLLCLEPSPLHAAGNRRLQPGLAEERGQLAPADLAADVCAALFRGRHSAQLAALQRLLPRGGQDMRLLFFRVGGWGSHAGAGCAELSASMKSGRHVKRAWS